MATVTGLRACVAMLAIGLLFGLAPAPAQESPDEATLSLGYNEEVVRKLLNEADPDVAFLARLKMMRGHLNVAIANIAVGDVNESRAHVLHPSTEILPEIVAAASSERLGGLSQALLAAVAILNKGDAQDTQKAIMNALDIISVGESAVDPAKLTANGISPDVIVLLLRTAVVEYNEAFEYGKIANIVEYHDGAAFVVEARAMLKNIESALAARDPETLDKILKSYATLETAWPSFAPPKNAVLPVSKMLALVTIIELNLNRMRGGA